MDPMTSLTNQNTLYNSDVTKLCIDRCDDDYNVEKCGCEVLIPKYIGPSNAVNGKSKQVYSNR
jgi:hypothetical protein